MSARTGNTVYVPGKGTYNTKKKTYAGKGPAPKGAKKVREKSASEVPTVTVSASGVTTSGFGSQKAARRAQRAQERRSRRVNRILRETGARPQGAAKIRSPEGVTAKAGGAGSGHSRASVPKPSSTPQTFQGKKTAGTPTLKSLRQASRNATLKVNKAGYVTTPEVRQASRKLKKARKAVAKTKPKIEGLYTKQQERFAETLSKKTKIPPKLVGEWVKQESGGTSAGQGGEAGEQNQLGVGYPGHPTAFSQSKYFNRTTPEKAAKATAKWMEGKIGSEYGYPVASSIKGIPALAKSGASEEEIRHYIEGGSGWGTGHISSGGITATPAKNNPKARRQLKQAKAQAKAVGLHVGPRPVKRLKGEWAGTKDILLNAARGISISSEKRSPAHNAEIGGSPTSDHLTTNKNAFATDLPTTNGVPIAQKVSKRLGIKGWSSGNYDWYTSPKYPGYRFQVLWAVPGHYDHVHVGAEWTGEKLPPGTISGGYAGGGSATFTPTGGGSSYSVPAPPKEVREGLSVTPQERFERLENLGVGVSPDKSGAQMPSTSELKRLEAKYGVAA